jgi:ribosome-binding protein aMBF1 (putative translation factor)
VGGSEAGKLEFGAMVPKVRGLIVVDDDSIVAMRKKPKTQIQEHFGKRVRELRKLRGLSQESLALACDLDRTYIGGVERGERNISLINIHKIAQALGLKAKELFNA